MRAWILLASLGAAFAGSGVVAAQDAAPKTLSGSWSATSLKESWSTTDWGADCGPKPTSSGGAPGGTTNVTQQGSELSFSGPGRAFSTTECWEQLPGLKRTSHSGGTRGWSNRCASPAGDPRRATVSNTTAATDDTITFSETGVFEWKIKEDVCKASVSRSRSYKLLARAGEAEPAQAEPAKPASPAPSAAPTAAAPPDPPPSADCTTPGPVARIEARPARKLLRPGERYRPLVRASDKNGCGLQPSYELRLPATSVLSDVVEIKDGEVVAKTEAKSVSGKLEVYSSGRVLTLELEIATADQYDALLNERGLNEAGEDDRASMLTLDAGIGGGPTLGEDAASARRLTFAAIVVGLGMLLGLAALVLYRRGKRTRNDDDAPESHAAPSNVTFFDSDATKALECARCGRVYPPDVGFCEEDGTALAPSLAPPPKPSASEPPPSTHKPKKRLDKICPSCGERFPAEAAFCGTDGTTLVQIN